MMRFLYSIVFYLALPLILSRLLWRAIKAPAYALRWSERFGLATPITETKSVIWIHAVSVGETIAATPMIRALLQRHPNKILFITSTTPTGSRQVSDTFKIELADGRILSAYAPYDLPTCVARFLKRVHPQLLIVMETEIWPNWIAACKKRNIPVVLANGRLSEKSARGYQKIRWLMKPAFAALTRAVMQHQADAARMIELGLVPESCEISGNIKFDLMLDDETRQAASTLRQVLDAHGEKIIWIAASTHKGEDEIIIEAYKRAKQECSELLLILVPRHPERFDSVSQLCADAGLKIQRRSQMHEVSADTNVIVGDTMGELLVLYGAADIAFVGGSLVEVGGHNLIEPAAWALPIIAGPHLFNFAEASRLLMEADALEVKLTAAEIADYVVRNIKNNEERKAKGEKALAVANSNRGALEKLLEIIDSELR